MRSRFLAVAVVVAAFSATGRTDDTACSKPCPAKPSDRGLYTCEVRVVTVPVEALDGCGLKDLKKDGDIAILSDPGCSGLLAAVAGMPLGNVQQLPKLTLANGQKETVRAVKQESYVTGVDVRQEKGQLVMAPKTTSVDLGIVLGLSGQISADSKSVTFQVNLKRSHVDGEIALFPVTTFISPVPEGGKVGSPVPFTQFIQLPKIAIMAVETSLNVPFGRHAVFAGSVRAHEDRYEFGPPILSDLPYIGRLFTNIGITQTMVRTLVIVSPVLVTPVEPATSAIAPTPRLATNTKCLTPDEQVALADGRGACPQPESRALGSFAASSHLGLIGGPAPTGVIPAMPVATAPVPCPACAKPQPPAVVRESFVYRLKHTTAADVVKALNAHLGGKRGGVVLVAEPVSNTLLIVAYPEQCRQLQELVTKLDQAPEQVTIAMKVVTVPAGFCESVGIATKNSESMWMLSEREVKMLDTALRAEPKTEVLSRPTLQMAHAQTGSCQIGQQFPLSATNHTFLGTTIRVTPNLQPDGKSAIFQSEIVHSSLDEKSTDTGKVITPPTLREQHWKAFTIMQFGQTFVVRMGGTTGPETLVLMTLAPAVAAPAATVVPTSVR